MVLAKDAGMKPRDLADMLLEELRKLPGVTRAEAAGPGFINLSLAPSAFENVLREAVVAGVDFGRSTLGGGAKVNVEYVSANPTGRCMSAIAAARCSAMRSPTCSLSPAST